MSTKFDSGKPRPELLPSAALLEISKVMAFGAKKYGDNNWREGGFDWTRIMGAMQRHLLAFNDGEDLDPETGLSHIAHVGCNALFLLEHILKGYGDDNRFNETGFFFTQSDNSVSYLIDTDDYKHIDLSESRNS